MSFQTNNNNNWATAEKNISENLNYVKDTIVEDATWAKDKIVEDATWVKDRALEDAKWAKDTIVDDATWAKDRAMEDAKWAKDKVVEDATWAKDKVVEDATWSKDQATEDAKWAKDRATEDAKWAKDRLYGTAENIKNTAENLNYAEYAKVHADKTVENVKQTVNEHSDSARKTIGENPQKTWAEVVASNIDEMESVKNPIIEKVQIEGLESAENENAKVSLVDTLTFDQNLAENVSETVNENYVDNTKSADFSDNHKATSRTVEQEGLSKDPRPESFQKPADQLAKELHEKVPLVNDTQNYKEIHTNDPRPERIQKPADELAKELHEIVPKYDPKPESALASKNQQIFEQQKKESQDALNIDLEIHTNDPRPERIQKTTDLLVKELHENVPKYDPKPESALASKNQQIFEQQKKESQESQVVEVIITDLPMPAAHTVTDVLTENLNYAKEVIMDSAVALKETFLPGIKLVRDDSPVLKPPVQTPSMKAREMHERILAENL